MGSLAHEDMEHVRVWKTHVLTLMCCRRARSAACAHTLMYQCAHTLMHARLRTTHVLTVSPNSAKRGMRAPTTPLTTGPLCRPMRICTASPLPVGHGTHAAASSMSWMVCRTNMREYGTLKRREYGALKRREYGTLKRRYHCAMCICASLPVGQGTARRRYQHILFNMTHNSGSEGVLCACLKCMPVHNSNRTKSPLSTSPSLHAGLSATVMRPPPAALTAIAWGVVPRPFTTSKYPGRWAAHYGH